MNAGESFIATCGNCNQEFEVVLEPKAKNMPISDRPKDKARVEYCPFCGAVELDSVEVDLG